MWRRLAAARIHDLARKFPAILILGARQVGKTTLAQQVFPDYSYCDLEEPRLRELFTDDPTFQIESRAKPNLVLDEAQAVPSVFAALRGIIDRSRSRNGRFVILGSAQPALVRDVSESLAGRVGIVDLDPLTIAEVESGKPRITLEDVWLRGGFPDSLRGSHRDWWESYLRTYVERDLTRLGLRPDPTVLRRLLTMLAHSQGGLLNASQLGNSLDVSYHTVMRYLDILEQTFLVRRLTPFFRNVGKRLRKSPKVYLRDTGLLHHLLNITTLGELDEHPIRGASWETLVLEDLIRRERLAHPHSQFFFWRTAAGAEIDLLIERGSERFAIEIKAGQSGHPRAVASLEQAANDVRVAASWIIDQGGGIEPLRAEIERRGMRQSVRWLPEGRARSKRASRPID
jgi:hypothetical protein